MLLKLLTCFLILIHASLGQTDSPYSTELRARLFLTRVNQKMFPLYDDIYRLTLDRQQHEYQSELEVVKAKIDDIASLTQEALEIPILEIKDPDLRLAIRNIQRAAYFYILGGEGYHLLSLYLDEMMSPALKKSLCDYESTHDCKLAYVPDIQNMIANNDFDPDRLLYYWTEWRVEIETHSRPQFKPLLNLYRLAANKTNVNPIELIYNHYNGDLRLIDNMKEVMQQLMPLYKEFHAYARNELNKKFGDKVVSKTGPIPDHLFQVILLQAWKKKGIINQPYPKEKLPNLKAGLQSQQANVETFIDMSEYYYMSMGFNRLPKKIRSNLNRKPGHELGSQCKAEIYDQTPNVRMEYCSTVNIKKYLQMHGYMGKIYYAHEKKNLPFHFFNSYKFENAVGEAVILSASSPNHLQSSGLVGDLVYTPELRLNHLFRMGLHTLFKIPVYYVHLRLIEDIVSGAVDLQNINVHYWNLMEQYAGVEPPINRNIEALDLPYKFFEDLKANRIVDKFQSEILGYQLYESLCKSIGAYNPSNSENHLHNCNFEGRTEVGEILKTMMASGSKKPWRETLSIVTGNENGLSAEGLLNYFAPVREWLQEQIKNENIFVGWAPSNKALNLKSAQPR